MHILEITSKLLSQLSIFLSGRFLKFQFSHPFRHLLRFNYTTHIQWYVIILLYILLLLIYDTLHPSSEAAVFVQVFVVLCSVYASMCYV